MKPLTATIVVAALVAAGVFARGRVPGVENAVAVGGIGLALALISQLNDELAESFATLIVVAMIIVHIVPILRAVGLLGAPGIPDRGPGKGGRRGEKQAPKGGRRAEGDFI